MLVIFFFPFLILTCVLLNGFGSLLNHEKEPCLRCICEATSACLDLIACANKSITYNYWSKAEDLPIDDDNNDRKVLYNECIRNDTCILGIMDKYTDKIVKQLNDINCDGIIDCKDLFAVHLHGMNAKDQTSIFKIAQMKRFDRCQVNSSNLTDSGWKPSICIKPKFGET